MTLRELAESELDDLLEISARATPGPWRSMVEGRDHTSGSTFIMTGEESARGDDLELHGGTDADHDFIAAARMAVPQLVAEIKRLRGLSERHPDETSS